MRVDRGGAGIKQFEQTSTKPGNTNMIIKSTNTNTNMMRIKMKWKKYSRHLGQLSKAETLTMFSESWKLIWNWAAECPPKKPKTCIRANWFDIMKGQQWCDLGSAVCMLCMCQNQPSSFFHLMNKADKESFRKKEPNITWVCGPKHASKAWKCNSLWCGPLHYAAIESNRELNKSLKVILNDQA